MATKVKNKLEIQKPKAPTVPKKPIEIKPESFKQFLSRQLQVNKEGDPRGSIADQFIDFIDELSILDAESISKLRNAGMYISTTSTIQDSYGYDIDGDITDINFFANLPYDNKREEEIKQKYKEYLDKVESDNKKALEKYNKDKEKWKEKKKKYEEDLRNYALIERKINEFMRDNFEI
jgi:hypothetical protein